MKTYVWTSKDRARDHAATFCKVNAGFWYKEGDEYDDIYNDSFTHASFVDFDEPGYWESFKCFVVFNGYNNKVAQIGYKN